MIPVARASGEEEFGPGAAGAGSQQAPGGHPVDHRDRCTYPKPFEPDFAACPAYQQIAFLAADSMNRPLGRWHTCQHLVTGTDDQRGHFYPRCALGNAEDRGRWLAMAGPAEAEVVRVLYAEFDDFTWPLRVKLLTAKAEVLGSRKDSGARLNLAEVVEEFLAATRGFIAEHAARLEGVGLPPGPLVELIEDWLHAWMRSSELDGPEASLVRLQAFSAAAQAFVANPAEGPWRVDRPEDLPVKESASRRATPLLDDGMVVVARGDGDDELVLSGSIDASNSAAIAKVLADEINGAGDLRMDLGGLVFCDIGGMRAIVRAAEGRPEGRRVVLRRMPAHLERAMKLAGWAELPHLVAEKMEA